MLSGSVPARLCNWPAFFAAIFVSCFIHCSLALGDDFRRAIEANSGRVVLVRCSVKADPSAEFLVQQGFAIEPKLIATIDCKPDAVDRIWESYESGSGWAKVDVAGKDLVSGYLVLRNSESLETDNHAAETVDETPETLPADLSVPGTLEMGTLELGLPTVVLWSEGGALHVKTAIASCLGNPMVRTPPSLDVEFGRGQLGAAVLDAEGRLLGLVGCRDSLFGIRADQGLLTNHKAITIDVIASARILENLINRIRLQTNPPELDLGFLGVRLGNGDASIRSVVPRSAAARRGITSGSRIVSLNRMPMSDDAQVVEAISYLRAGDSVLLRLETEAEDGSTATREVDVKLRGLRTRPMVRQGSNGSSDSAPGPVEEPTSASRQFPLRSQLDNSLSLQELRDQVRALQSEIALLRQQLQDFSDAGKPRP